ncbi:NAD(P)-dependent dehydrogenase, short-chain alcohol dehydrogenase family [Microbispora rosea]|uniref:NAD(P)-dependent dehydrogenase, short-chain alcohol dehydrogenase family n=1 Tax=Microbispora rosea TaxID=58117 RepID=A0A1N7H381_9ACTN|nr:glucose 1-dehydrogenase [Microbispora rosea]GIH44829.1 short chain dehydrogenase [Microbispora rosea subsp. rosea]SIS19220.1 NAD(P)-dependent dehydrogenase, short-chain alcohol dehydrogenase family [Microbispora rosea]
MTIRLDDRVAIVTGAASGIGASAAVAIAAAGAHVVLADIAGCEDTERAIKNVGGDSLTIRTDVSRADDVKSLVARTIAAYGRLDHAFNNAGTEGRAEHEIHEADEEAWDQALAVNLKGVWLAMKYQVPAMLDSGGGSIVNGASVAAMVAFDKNGSYVAGKHAILGLTKTAALEYADRGVRVNAVCPGVVRTPFIERFTGNVPEVEARYTEIIPLGRMAEPEEVAKAVVWLLSDESSYVTGHGLVIDGGLVAR